MERSIEWLLSKSPQSPLRLQKLADQVIRQLKKHGLPNAKGGSTTELRVPGLARTKNWDVAYEFAGKFRLLVSLKSMLKNAAGTVPNRLDDLLGEIANVQQLAPELVIGYVVLFDVATDSKRDEDGLMWSDFFERALRDISIRGAPLWNQGLLEASWFVRFDSRKPSGSRLVDARRAAMERDIFVRAIVCELARREPAVPLSRPLDCAALTAKIAKRDARYPLPRPVPKVKKAAAKPRKTRRAAEE